MSTQKRFPTEAIPTTDADRITWLRLIRSRRVGPATFQRLMRCHGSAGAALEALPRIAAEAGVKGYEIAEPHVAEQELAAAAHAGAELIAYGAAAYPKPLYDLPDPPPVLWAIGRRDLLECSCVAVVGARNASSAGMNMARKLARELGAAGLAVVSGLARGIDRAAQEAALEAGTIAVLAGGADVDYPQECSDLATAIRERGLCLSEMPMGLAPRARHFPPRNRIISGMAAGVVVVEGAARSGSLITARNALDQGREVMAVPGSPLDARAAGCNMLIRDGATLVRNAADVLEALAPAQPGEPAPASPEPAPPQPAPVADLPRGAVLRLLGPTPVTEDDIIAELGAPAKVVLAVLSELELEGAVTRAPGGQITRAMAVDA